MNGKDSVGGGKLTDLDQKSEKLITDAGLKLVRKRNVLVPQRILACHISNRRLRSLVKLQKRSSYRYKDKEHYEYILTIPTGAFEQMDSKPEPKLEVQASNESILLSPLASEVEALSSEAVR